MKKAKNYEWKEFRKEKEKEIILEQYSSYKQIINIERWSLRMVWHM